MVGKESTPMRYSGAAGRLELLELPMLLFLSCSSFFNERLELPMLFSSVLKSTVFKYLARAACRRALTPCLA